MRRDSGPREMSSSPGEPPGPPPTNLFTNTSPATTTQQKPAQPHSMPGRPRLGRYAAGWADGFAAGAADALRQAGRHLPPESWAVVAQLADAYELAGGDG
jgi:hypothetical protein